MSEPYRYVGDAESHSHGWKASPGDIAYFPRHPQGDWERYIPTFEVDPEPEPEVEESEEAEPSVKLEEPVRLRKPNSASSRADWEAYAIQEGEDPEGLTRVQIMEKFGVRKNG